MSLSQIDQAAAAAATLAVLMCGVTLLKTQLWALFLQAALLAAVCVLLSISEARGYLLLLACAMLAVKAAGIPLFLNRAAQRMSIARDAGTGMHPSLALLAGCGLFAAGYFLGPQFAVPEMEHPIAAGMAVAMLFIGMLLMITRRLAISQIIGFLAMENGISLYGLTQTRDMPMLLEMGVLFEVLICVLIAVVVIFRINRSFEHIDLTQMRRLRH
jgi:hydrogenase-4 component E